MCASELVRLMSLLPQASQLKTTFFLQNMLTPSSAWRFGFLRHNPAVP
ncbi:hypothetical protein PXO_01336 [Xanthomonas oryzae pv. oryzae PXO99A]|uniref:Uncharacterized protein n=1 Tax=Xanthomonas oryzae pv. oryzae (strain PXO99A) TaxID=360094 RepID=A0A0K0GML3_XANOP|nr:hypothetical protein PXO_01336 [Xanthomonas oryzae pv. oryzae PXO99A]